jgi:hypothetical protein
VRLDNSFIKLKNIIYRGIRWNLSKIKIDMTWRMLGGGMLIVTDVSFNVMIGLTTSNRLQMIELYLNNIPKRGNSSSLDFT